MSSLIEIVKIVQVSALLLVAGSAWGQDFSDEVLDPPQSLSGVFEASPLYCSDGGAILKPLVEWAGLDADQFLFSSTYTFEDSGYFEARFYHPSFLCPFRVQGEYEIDSVTGEVQLTFIEGFEPEADPQLVSQQVNGGDGASQEPASEVEDSTGQMENGLAPDETSHLAPRDRRESGGECGQVSEQMELLTQVYSLVIERRPRIRSNDGESPSFELYWLNDSDSISPSDGLPQLCSPEARVLQVFSWKDQQ